MLRTVSIKLATTSEQASALCELQRLFNKVCNMVAVIAKDNRCWNHVDLHHLAYYQIRLAQDVGLGSQMVCNAIKAVCDAYKALKIKKTQSIPKITFMASASVHFDKRTYSLRGEAISLYTLSG